jgi:hypothetical protein
MIHTQTAKATAPELTSVVKTQVELLRKVSDLMQSLDSTNPVSLKQVDALLSAGLNALRGEASTEEPVAATDLSVRKQAFIEKYGISAFGNSKVSFTIPKGASVLDLLNDAQALSPELYNRDAVYPNRLADWSTKKAFKSNVTEAKEFSLDGNVSDSTNKTRSEQVTFLKKQKLEMPEIEHLAAAHSAFLIATGKDLFADKVVRARGGALFFNAGGLCVFGSYDDHRLSGVAASAALPARN